MTDTIFRYGEAMDQPSLRERKKRQTARALWTTAITLFTEHGFDKVNITQIADAANVSKMTVFNYFPTKEDLVLKPLEDHTGEPARVIRECLASGSGLDALRRHVLAAIASHDPMLGISDNPNVLAVHRLVLATPALFQRAARSARESEDLLARELGTRFPAVVARIAVAQIAGVLGALRLQNLERLVAGETPAAVEPAAAANANLAFDILEHGLGTYLDKPAGPGTGQPAAPDTGAGATR
jgi:AcrR family transcriptional regulator